MANICVTDIYFTGDNPADMRKLYKFLKDNKNDTLYSYLELAGIDPKLYSCKGNVIYLDEFDNDDAIYDISISVESAWTPTMKVWVDILNKLKLNDIEINYITEEVGQNIFYASDDTLIPSDEHRYKIMSVIDLVEEFGA